MHAAKATPYEREVLVFMIFLSVQLARFAYRACNMGFAPITKALTLLPNYCALQLR
jgi:hypothetical protein